MGICAIDVFSLRKNYEARRKNDQRGVEAESTRAEVFPLSIPRPLNAAQQFNIPK